MKNTKPMNREEQEWEQIVHGLSDGGMYHPERSDGEYEDRFVRKHEARIEETEQSIPTVDM